MNRFEIRHILNSHREHFRVLPPATCQDLNSIIDSVDAEIAERNAETERLVQARLAETKPKKTKKKTKKK